MKSLVSSSLFSYPRLTPESCATISLPGKSISGVSEKRGLRPCFWAQIQLRSITGSCGCLAISGLNTPHTKHLTPPSHGRPHRRRVQPMLARACLATCALPLSTAEHRHNIPPYCHRETMGARHLRFQ